MYGMCNSVTPCCMSHYTVCTPCYSEVVSYLFAVLVGWLGRPSGAPSGPLPCTVTVFKPVGVA